MPNRGRYVRRRARRSGGGRGRQIHVGDEFFTASIPMGTGSFITSAVFKQSPQRCNIRPLFLRVEAVQPYVPEPASTGQVSAYFCPGAFEAQFIDYSTSQIVATSKPRMLGANPRNIWVRYPRSAGWIPYDMNQTTKIGILSAICVGPANVGNTEKAYVRVMCQLRYQFSFEVLSNTCPTLLNNGRFLQQPIQYNPVEEGEDWSEHVDEVLPLSTSGSSILSERFARLNLEINEIIAD